MTVSFVDKQGGECSDSRMNALLRYHPDGSYVVTVESKREWDKHQKRTNNQNALLWAFLVDASKVLNREYGDEQWDKNSLKDYLCDRLASERYTPDGKVYRKAMSTSSLSKEGMSNFLLRCQALLATEHHVSVPLPGDEDYELFRREIDGEYY